MSSQGSLKHASTEPSHLSGKGVEAAGTRRAGGRAAALRRAPSDSDCSGETGSLSADSGEHAPPTVRHAAPAPPAQPRPQRTGKRGKVRGRRRGSEWEFLEGLKEGQRFEKRPEVFNGYLHKKRKWPLKGWHKRYFVVDGGILVYARGPSDIARGRLHGSVDVGFSVISAKQRRRRIDIDAEEFIYHLRAKTPEAFRDWLNMLKAHRLYRQHLLNFGGRESAPRVSIAKEDVTITESLSQTSSSSIISDSLTSCTSLSSRREGPFPSSSNVNNICSKNGEFEHDILEYKIRHSSLGNMNFLTMPNKSDDKLFYAASITCCLLKNQRYKTMQTPGDYRAQRLKYLKNQNNRSTVVTYDVQKSQKREIQNALNDIIGNLNTDIERQVQKYRLRSSKKSLDLRQTHHSNELISRTIGDVEAFHILSSVFNNFTESFSRSNSANRIDVIDKATGNSKCVLRLKNTMYKSAPNVNMRDIKASNSKQGTNNVSRHFLIDNDNNEEDTLRKNQNENVVDDTIFKVSLKIRELLNNILDSRVDNENISMDMRKSCLKMVNKIDLMLANKPNNLDKPKHDSEYDYLKSTCGRTIPKEIAENEGDYHRKEANVTCEMTDVLPSTISINGSVNYNVVHSRSISSTTIGPDIDSSSQSDDLVGSSVRSIPSLEDCDVSEMMDNIVGMLPPIAAGKKMRVQMVCPNKPHLKNELVSSGNSRSILGHFGLSFEKEYQVQYCHVQERRLRFDPVCGKVQNGFERKDSDQSPIGKGFQGLGSPTGAGGVRGPQGSFVSGTPGGRLASWIVESGGPLESAGRELGQAQLSVQQLQRLLEALELQQQVHHDTDVSLEGASPNVKKDRRKFGLRKKKSTSSKCGSVDLLPPQIDPSLSHTALSALTAPPSPGGVTPPAVPSTSSSLPIACAAARPQSLPGPDALGATGAGTGPASLTSLTPDHQLREDFTVLAKDLLTSLKGVASTLGGERARLRAALQAADSRPAPASLAALRSDLDSALQMNSELKTRLARIHDASDLGEMSSVGPGSEIRSATRAFQPSLSYSSSCVSASEFFDAEEHGDTDAGIGKAPTLLDADVEGGVIELEGDTSSEAGSLSSEEGSASSENSDGLTDDPAPANNSSNGEDDPPNKRQLSVPLAASGRRTRLPCPRPNPSGPSLWNLLYKNIGKDLSQISMPVTINEPLNMLQRLCEELEYSSLLDAACNSPDPVERMSLVAAFAVSAYAAAAHRAASKPFNPLLGETYECVRQDRQFRFISEQVSHHPPVSVCHAESSRWTFWQEARIRTKFWGKSMEFQPAGRVHVRLNNTGDHYTWNKVTTCVHNLFGGQRWVDQYGDMQIFSSNKLSCKLNFIKASSWSASRHEVRGAVSEPGSRPLRLAGRWDDALYSGEPPAVRCLWRPGAMPPDHELYYGFTRFAIELNEMEPGLAERLPPTDTRLRPDQRALEEGDVETAERLKLQLEQMQRERRRTSPNHTPRWFKRMQSEGSEETWLYTGEYWKAREAGFHTEGPSTLW